MSLLFHNLLTQETPFQENKVFLLPGSSEACFQVTHGELHAVGRLYKLSCKSFLKTCSVGRTGQSYHPETGFIRSLIGVLLNCFVARIPWCLIREHREMFNETSNQAPRFMCKKYNYSRTSQLRTSGIRSDRLTEWQQISIGKDRHFN